jgi:hypothetical protein
MLTTNINMKAGAALGNQGPIPRTWVSDRVLDHESFRFLYAILAHFTLASEIHPSELIGCYKSATGINCENHTVEAAHKLQNAGYLVPTTTGYMLVHPTRIGTPTENDPFARTVPEQVLTGPF